MSCVGCGDVTAVLYELAGLPGAPLVDLEFDDRHGSAKPEDQPK